MSYFNRFLLLAAFCSGMDVQAQTACDTLEILSINYAPFSDTAVRIQVVNESSVLFDYPGFILFDENGDTLAVETVFYFGIGQESEHMLTIHPDAVVPVGTFQGTLELWTGFYDQMACSWSFPIDLCPAEECSFAQVELYNFGGALVNASFDWMVTDTLQNSLASGVFTMNDTVQYATDGVCLPAGEYFYSVNSDQITGGQLGFAITTGGFAFAGPQANLIQGGGLQSVSFSFFEACSSEPNAITEMAVESNVSFVVKDGMLHLTQLEGQAIGSLEVFDMAGRVVLSQNIEQPVAQLPLDRLASGIHVLHLNGSTSFKFMIP